MTIDVSNAEKKLRQAEFFLSHLEAAPEEIARAQAAARPERTDLLEFYYSACLTAAQSAFYALEKATQEAADSKSSGKKRFAAIKASWRKQLGDDRERELFNGMVNRRDDDVHFGTTDAVALPAAMPADSHRQGTYIDRHAALFGPKPLTSYTNPDGAEVTAPALRGTKRLYFDHHGKKVDAAGASRKFIGQLRSLCETVRASEASKG
jgi:hypothetical protein